MAEPLLNKIIKAFYTQRCEIKGDGLPYLLTFAVEEVAKASESRRPACSRLLTILPARIFLS